MILHVIFRPPRPRLDERPHADRIQVRYAHPLPGWLEYGAMDGSVHWISSDAVLEAWGTPEDGDPDPMGTQQP